MWIRTRVHDNVLFLFSEALRKALSGLCPAAIDVSCVALHCLIARDKAVAGAGATANASGGGISGAARRNWRLKYPFPWFHTL
jgi:hypothetical protein